MEFLRKIFKNSLPPKPTTTLAWSNELKGMDDISAIEYSTQQLNADFKNNVFLDEQCLEVLFSIDEKTHTIVERITAHYINIDSISIELEGRIANAVFLYHRQIFLIYLTLIENLAQIDPQSLLIMLARAINSATQMIKWRYYNYQSAPANVWLQISQLYKIAEQQSLLNSYVYAYPNAENPNQEPSTLSSAYIQVCMLGSLESLTLKCQQIDLISKILTQWTAMILIENVYDESKHLFYVDTASNLSAKRLRNSKLKDTYRYWCLDSINSKIELYISLIKFNISPKQQAMNEIINNKHALTTLEILRTEWSRNDYKRQRRGEERNKTVKSASIAYGFEDTCHQIKRNEHIQVQRGEKSYVGKKSFDERLSSHHVAKGYADPNIIYLDLGAGQSNIVNESGKGIGLHIGKHTHELSLCMMVGIIVKEQKYGIRIGIIRSIKTIAGNGLRIGVEVLSKTALCVEAKNTNLNAAKVSASTNDFNNANINFASSAAAFTCLFLPEEYGVSMQETLIVPRLQYNKNDMFKVNISGADMLVKFTDTLEQYEDWIRVAYSKEPG